MLVDHIGIPQLRDMATRSETVSGDVDIAELTRLAETLFSADSQKKSRIAAQFVIGSSMQGFPEISGTLSGKLALQCQRCLGLLEWPLELEFQLAVVESDEDTEDFAEPFDTVIAGEHGVRLADIVEDEVLSSLPLAPVHAHARDCEDAELLEETLVEDIAGSEIGLDKSEAETTQPFAGLADMLKKDSESGDT